MKKLFALVLGAMLAASAFLGVHAEEKKYVYENDFEKEPLGEYIAVDKTINVFKKDGTIEIVKFDGDNCFQFKHPAAKDGKTGYDSFIDMFIDSTKGLGAFGFESAYIIEFDVYFEKIGADMRAYMGMSRETPAAGTQFLTVGSFDCKEGVNVVSVTGIDDTGVKFEAGKWYTVAACIDVEKNIYSVYLDGKCLVKNMMYPETMDASATFSERYRLGFMNHTGDSVMYLDNIKGYNGSVPYSNTPATEETTASETTAESTPPTTDTTAQGETTASDTTVQDTSAETKDAGNEDGESTETADVAILLAAAAAAAASGAVVIRRRRK